MRFLLFVAGFGLLLPYWLDNLNFFLPAAIVVAMLLSYWKACRWIFVLVVAIGYSSYQVEVQVQQQLNGCPHKLQVQALLEIQEVQTAVAQTSLQQTTRLVGILRDLPAVSPSAQAFGPGGGCRAQLNQRYRLTWRSAPDVAVGSLWQVDLVLSEPWGYQNPGGFDYERWLLGSNLAATGYVRHGRLVAVAPTLQGLPRWRSILATQLARYSQAGVLQALVLGDVSKLDSQEWQRLRTSGTVHLFIVSGLHVGLVASASFFGASWLLRILPWVIARAPVQRLAVGVALGISALYVLLTGANVPGVRAWLMLCLALVWLGRGRRGDLWLGFLWALVIVLLCLPRSGWQLGFYLSFGAVGVLLWFFQPRHSMPTTQVDSPSPTWPMRLMAWLLVRFKLLFRVQVALLLGMAPLTIALGLVTPSLGLFVNLVAVPWVSLVVVPLALVGTLMTLLSKTLGHLLLASANEALLIFQHLLEVASVGGLWQPPRLAWWAHGLHGLVGLLCLTPLAWRVRVLVLLAYASILLDWQPRLPKGDFRVVVMDVGQGSAILVSTNRHHLLFDTGPAYESGFSAAQAVIEPTLGALAVRHLDGLIVSHGDVDHAGGAAQLREHWRPLLNLQGGKLPNKTPYMAVGTRIKSCAAGQRWIWDQVQFELLSPPVQSMRERGLTSNDASCVLRVTAVSDRFGTGQQALLLGDVSQDIELSLLSSLRPGVTFMTAPHHGSATSSSQALVRRLQPQWVVASAARHSRYGHPHAKVVDRYCNIGARFFVTGESGAVGWRSDQPHTIDLERSLAEPFVASFMRLATPESTLTRCR